MTSDLPQAPGAPLVAKFGGAALADGPSIARACRILDGAGPGPRIAVVSAIEGVTDLLESLAGGERLDEGLALVRLRHRGVLSQLALDPELCDRHLAELAILLESLRARGPAGQAERDHLLSFGERMSARIVAAALRAMGVSAAPVDAFDLGLRSDTAYGAAHVPGLDAIRAALERFLDVGAVPVVTGFLAADAAGRLTTLGRNGSDLSAALIGAALGAREVQFWKAVGGILSADPRVVPAARPLRRISYAQAREFGLHGAKVLHPDALAPLESAGIPARVLCVEQPGDPGTWIGAEGAGAGPFGIACPPLRTEREDEPARLALVGGALQAAEALQCLLSAGIAAALVQAEPDPSSAVLSVPAADLARAARRLHVHFFEAPGRPERIAS
jgi:aspartate kinase